MSVGLVVGRFQPLHFGHVAVLKQADAAVDELVVAIGSSQESGIERNPYDAATRRAMIEGVHDEVASARWRIVEVPDINDPPNWAGHCFRITGPVDVVFGHDEETLGLFRETEVDVVSVPFAKRDAWCGTTIRKQILDGDEAWRKAVPEHVAEIIARD